MASNTKQTRKIRAKKKKTQGRARKNAMVNHGTTPSREKLFKEVEEK